MLFVFVVIVVDDVVVVFVGGEVVVGGKVVIKCAGVGVRVVLSFCQRLFGGCEVATAKVMNQWVCVLGGLVVIVLL